MSVAESAETLPRSTAMPSELIQNSIIVLIGLVFVLVGFRVLGRKRGTSESADRWHAKYGKFFKIAGPVIVVGGLALFLLRFNTQPHAEGWSRHTTADGACSIEFPQVPKHEPKPGGEDGDRLVVSLDAVNASYSLSYSDLSPKDAAMPLDQLFATLRANYMLKSPPGTLAKLVREEAITEAGIPGREFQFAVGQQLVSRIKVFVKGSRVYRAIAVNPPDEKLDRDAERFINSFRFEGPKE